MKPQPIAAWFAFWLAGIIAWIWLAEQRFGRPLLRKRNRRRVGAWWTLPRLSDGQAFVFLLALLGCILSALVGWEMGIQE